MSSSAYDVRESLICYNDCVSLSICRIKGTKINTTLYILHESEAYFQSNVFILKGSFSTHICMSLKCPFGLYRLYFKLYKRTENQTTESDGNFFFRKWILFRTFYWKIARNICKCKRTKIHILTTFFLGKLFFLNFFFFWLSGICQFLTWVYLVFGIFCIVCLKKMD